MSVVAMRTRPAAATILVAAAGLAALAARAAVPPLRPAAAIALFVAIAAAAAAVPARPGVRRASAAPVAALGLAGVGLAWWIGAPAPALPTAGWTLAIGLLAAVAEELLFRRVLYDALADRGEGVAIAVTALAFAAIHVSLYGIAAFPVDLGAGLVLSWQRWASGTWTAPAGTHAAANLLAVLR